MNARNIPPVEVRHRWKYQHTHTIETQTVYNVSVCEDCGSWTGNLPLYLNDVCAAKDRRKGLQDRRTA